MVKRLVTFIGLSNYVETNYELDNQRCCTCYVARALAEFLKPHEIVVFATDEAWEKHGVPLSLACTSSGIVEPRRIAIPLGRSTSELWQQFDSMMDALNCDGEVAFDITSGFRAQPFFASAVIQFYQSIHPDCSELSVYYGPFEAHDLQENTTPIWNLTAFVELLRWSRAVLLFLRTGRADDIAQPTERLGKELQKQWADGGKKGDRPSLAPLGRAIQEFGDDFVTLRTGALISNQRSSAQRLLEVLERAESEVTQYLPPLSSVFKQVLELVRPLAGSPQLSKLIGQCALQSLAKTYLSMGRYAEAAATVREGWISKFACPQADSPGEESFVDERRFVAEESWFLHDEEATRALGQLRNDIEHAGYRRQPMPSRTIKRQLEVMINKWSALDEAPERLSVISASDSSAVEHVMYSIGVDHPIAPDEPLPEVPEVPRGAVVVIEGRAPIWRYGMAIHRLHGSPAGAIAVFDPRLGAVIVTSHHPNWREGQVLDIPGLTSQLDPPVSM